MALAFLSMAVNSSAEIFLSLELTVSCIRWALMAEFRMFSSELDLLAVSNFWMTWQRKYYLTYILNIHFQYLVQSNFLSDVYKAIVQVAKVSTTYIKL